MNSICSKDAIRHKEIAGMEAQIYRLIDLLSEQRAATIDNVRRKQAKAGEGADSDNDSEGGDISDDGSEPGEDGMIYNPKNLPLGWDGKVRTTFQSTSPLKLLFLLAHSLLVIQITWFEYVFQL